MTRITAMTDKIDSLTLAAINLLLLVALCFAFWGITALAMIALVATPVVLLAIVRLTLFGDLTPDQPS
jgi:hypothetical protein